MDNQPDQRSLCNISSCERSPSPLFRRRRGNRAEKKGKGNSIEERQENLRFSVVAASALEAHKVTARDRDSGWVNLYLYSKAA